MPFQTFFNLPQDKQESIVSAAIDEFYDYGYQKASIARIVEATGIARGSFYQYFENKQDIYRYLILDVIGGRKHEYTRRFFKQQQTFADLLRELLAGGVAFFRDYPKMAAIANDYMQLRDKGLKQQIAGDSYEQGKRFFLERITAGKECGDIDERIDPEALYYLIYSVGLSISQDISEQDIASYTDEQLAEYVNRYVFILQNGMKGRA